MKWRRWCAEDGTTQLCTQDSLSLCESACPPRTVAATIHTPQRPHDHLPCSHPHQSLRTKCSHLAENRHHLRHCTHALMEIGPGPTLACTTALVARDRHGHPVPAAPTDDDALSTEAGAAAVAPSASGGGDGGGGGGGAKKKVANLAYASSNKRAMERVKEIVDALPVGITPRTVLDIGCADGSITGAIAETLGIPPERAHGVDIAGLGEKCVHTAHCVKHALVDTACARAHARPFCSAVCK
jgi:hypothetical protein